PEDYLRNGNARREQALASLVRSCIAIARGTFETGTTPSEIARRLFGAEAARDLGVIERAASAPAATTQTGWAAELAHVTLEFLASLIPISAAANVLSRGLQLRFDGNNAITLPTINQIPASFTGQGKAIQVKQFQTAAGTTLLPHAFKAITTLTHEMLT